MEDGHGAKVEENWLGRDGNEKIRIATYNVMDILHMTCLQCGFTNNFAFRRLQI